MFLDAERSGDQGAREACDPPRFDTVGVVDGLCVTLAFAMEGDLAIIIPARLASR